MPVQPVLVIGDAPGSALQGEPMGEVVGLVFGAVLVVELEDDTVAKAFVRAIVEGGEQSDFLPDRIGLRFILGGRKLPAVNRIRWC